MTYHKPTYHRALFGAAFQIFVLVVFLLIGHFLVAGPASAQTQCRDLGPNNCAQSEACMLDIDAAGQNYLCRPAQDRCEIGYPQHAAYALTSKDSPKMRCEARSGCHYQDAEQCYCPKLEGISCVCDGGRPHQCINDAALKVQSPSGTYEIVTLRRASDVAGQPIPPTAAEAIGAKVEFAEENLSFGGMACDRWDIKPIDLLVRLETPDLRDALVGPVPLAHSSGDKRILQSWSYTCEETDTFYVTQIDPRIVVLHLHNSSIHAIAERPMTSDTVKRMQAALKSVKYYSGAIDGKLNEDTLRAASFWAEYRMPEGQRLMYKRPALSLNLFDTMGVFE